MKQQDNAAVQASQIETHEQCISCHNHITQPICPCCIAKSFHVWLRDVPHLKNEVQHKVHHFIAHTQKIKGIRCVRCRAPKVHTCPYCFTDFLHSIIKEAGAGVRIMSQFLFMFNFDFERTGYALELEVYDGY